MFKSFLGLNPPWAEISFPLFLFLSQPGPLLPLSHPPGPFRVPRPSVALSPRSPRSEPTDQSTPAPPLPLTSRPHLSSLFFNRRRLFRSDALHDSGFSAPRVRARPVSNCSPNPSRARAAPHITSPHPSRSLSKPHRELLSV